MRRFVRLTNFLKKCCRTSKRHTSLNVELSRKILSFILFWLQIFSQRSTFFLVYYFIASKILRHNRRILLYVFEKFAIFGVSSP